MRLSKVKYHNFRGFEEKEFSLDSPLVLFVGDNAKGKTSALRGIALALSSWVSAFPEIKSLKYTWDDVRKVAVREGAEIPTFNPSSESFVKCIAVEDKGPFNIPTPIDWIRQYGSHSNSDYLKKEAKQYLQSIEKEKQTDLPYFGFYGTGRLWNVDKRLTEKKEKTATRDSRYKAYQDALEASSTEKLLRKWIAKLRFAEFTGGKPSSVLASVWTCLKKIIPGVLNVDWNPKEEDLVFEFKDGKSLPLSNLSEGQRIVASLVTDLCIRISLLNPHLNGYARELTTGVVLIDEIDLHLHPKWQKTIVPNLAELFPNIQFILTSHSPFIIQSLEGVKGARIINLDDDESPYDYSRQTYRSVEDIAENVMNVVMPQRSEHYMAMKKAAKDFFDLLKEVSANENAKEAAKRKLDELVARYGTDNPAYAAFLESKAETAGVV
ncbi:AAA family ATPase [Candidatus Saccharibacteria bacterium]|nr:AAA family ATPase [Candidatus Saccharibacteria bacterium]